MKKIILLSILLITYTQVTDAQNIRKFDIDVNKEKGKLDTFFKECIGAGRANEGLRADWQEQLKMVKDDCGFKFIRFHGIFHDDMGVYRESEDGEPIYNWMYIDKLYDYILSIGMKPFVEMSFMPKDLASGEETVFWWKGNITPPKSYEKYSKFIKAFVQHLTNRYGEQEVSSWYFEVWNEPNLNFFWTGGFDGYEKMYQSAVKVIKEVSNTYRVGGPATAGAGWVKEHLEYCEKENVPCEFVATHAYNVSGFLDEFGTSQLKMLDSPNDVTNQVIKARNQIDDTSFSGLELHLTEWSSSYSPLDPVHDTYQNATFILNTLKNVEGKVSSMSYWVFTDIFEESGVPAIPFHGGFGLVNLQGIKKPTYYAYKYLNELGETELENSDKNSWVCKDENGVQILIYDFTYLKQGKESNKVFFTKKHKAKEVATSEISLTNLKDGKYQLLVYKTGYLNNDAFTNYYNLGMPSQLSKKQTDFLKSVTNNQPLINKVVSVTSGAFSTSVKLNENDIVLVKLNKL
ncbi:cellulase family glycosylhydrolase [Flavobacteriaceae bacterium MHTCC 0001]